MRRPGFTLVEVLIVVAIIGIAGAVIVPHMLRAGSLTVQGAGRQLIADILYAQNDAIARQGARTVTFDPVNNRYWLADDKGNRLTVSWKAPGAANYVVDLAADSRFHGVRITRADFGGAAALSFDALGSPSAGGSVDLEADGGFRYRITVAALTGRVTIAPLTGG